MSGKGFGVPSVELRKDIIPPFGGLDMFQYRGRNYIELSSFFRVIGREAPELQKEAFNFSYRGVPIRAIRTTTASEYLMQNGIVEGDSRASGFHQKLLTAGLDQVAADAEAAGLNYIVMPNGDKIRFGYVDGERVFGLDDVTAAIGKTPADFYQVMEEQ